MKTNFRKFLDSRSLNSVKVSGNSNDVSLDFNIFGMQSNLWYCKWDSKSKANEHLKFINTLREALDKYEAHIKWLAVQPEEDLV